MKKLIVLLTLIITLAFNQKSHAEIYVVPEKNSALIQLINLIEQYPSIIINSSIANNSYSAVNQYILTQLQSLFRASQNDTAGLESVNKLLANFSESLELFQSRNELIKDTSTNPEPDKIYANYAKNKVRNSVARILALNS